MDKLEVNIKFAAENCTSHPDSNKIKNDHKKPLTKHSKQRILHRGNFFTHHLTYHL